MTTPLADRLRRETQAEIHDDRGTRGVYSTDASLYEIQPQCVVVPRSARDVVGVVAVAADLGIPIIPRGGGTSLSGQTVGEGIVIDFSKWMNRIGVVDRDRMTVRVEPGVVLERLNTHLKPMGLMFGPDVSTSDRATLGGMIGNNSAGARSLRYGKMVDHVQALEVVFSDGTTGRLGAIEASELDALCARPDILGRVHKVAREQVIAHEQAIRAHFPRILRRVSGYNLDELVPGLPIRPTGWIDPPWRFNLSKLVTGAEGTLAVVLSADVSVTPLPAAEGLVVMSFASIPHALDQLSLILRSRPSAVEMLDRMILDLAASNPHFAKALDFTSGRPGAVLAAQLHADSQTELEERARALENAIHGCAGLLGVRTRLADAARDDFWKIRKAGFALVMGMVGDAKPIAFVEDTAVDPARLPEFHARFESIVSRHEIKAACYGHADVGCLHIRPILSVKTKEGVEMMRAIAREVSDLVLEFQGAMSGEHGDGLARTLWNRKLFGQEVYTAFQSVKAAFDPRGLLNPGKVIGDQDLGANLRISPDYHPVEPAQTMLDFSGQGGFARAVEMCSGVGVCRKTEQGVMCPSYMATRDETHTTRGRANLLRLAMTGKLETRGTGLGDDSLWHALDLCLECKACKSECPSQVDMAKLKSEALHARYQNSLRPLNHHLFANLFRLGPLGSALAPITNGLLANPIVKRALEGLFAIDRRRNLPRYVRPNFRQWFNEHTQDPRAGGKGRVILLDDCFTTYHEPSVGIASVQVLEAAGYTVERAGIACCGRPAISKGMLHLARDLASAAVAHLAPLARAGIPIVGCEPSCIAALVDEYPDFRLGDDARIVARQTSTVEAFIAKHLPDLPLATIPARVLFHGHCHQKAVVGIDGTVAALRAAPGLEVVVLDAGCCGMAGSFGYETGHYDVSVQLANRVLIPALAAHPDATLAASGFSCRSQVHDILGTIARHPIEILADRLKG